MMLLCPICAGEFEVLQIALCPGCGEKLVPESMEYLAEEPDEARTDTIEFEELCRPNGYSIAMLIKQMLEQNGIIAVVQGGHSMSVLPSLTFLGQMRVLVDKRKFDYAKELYTAYFENPDLDSCEFEEGSSGEDAG